MPPVEVVVAMCAIHMIASAIFVDEYMAVRARPGVRACPGYKSFIAMFVLVLPLLIEFASRSFMPCIAAVEAECKIAARAWADHHWQGRIAEHWRPAIWARTKPATGVANEG